MAKRAKAKRKPAKCKAKRKTAKRKAAKRPIGRPTKMDHTIHVPTKDGGTYETTIGEYVIAEVRAGNYIDTAARCAGIDRSTVRVWMQKGRDGNPRYVAFHDGIKKARADAESYAVRCIRQAFGQDWRAAMTYLERSRPKRWARPAQEVRMGGTGDDKPVKLNVSGMPDDLLRRLREYTDG